MSTHIKWRCRHHKLPCSYDYKIIALEIDVCFAFLLDSIFTLTLNHLITYLITTAGACRSSDYYVDNKITVACTEPQQICCQVGERANYTN